MKLIIAIIQNDYVKDVMYEMIDNNIRATKLASTGGFLKSGNTTLLIGVEEERLDLTKEIIEKNCSFKNIDKDGEDIEVSGANLFILDMNRSLRV